MHQHLIDWTVEIRRLRTQLRATDDAAGQAVWIDLAVRARTLAVPASIADCVDYQPICRWILDELPRRGQRREGALRALIDFVFAADDRIESVDAAICVAGADGEALTIACSRQEHDPVHG